MPKPYQVVCVQAPIHQARSRKDVKDNIARIAGMLDLMVFMQRRRLENRGAGDVKLVAFPEYGFSDWRRIAHGSIKGDDIAIEIPGPETEPLARVARDNNLFIAAQALEVLPALPGHYMNTGFIIGPKGDVIYKRHKLRHGLLVLYTGPNDIIDRYMAMYANGRSVGETVFPVVDTEIGVLGMSICHEIATPEVARQLASNGAEVIIRPTNEPDLAARLPMDRARAMENRVYCVVANSGYSVEDTTMGDCGTSAIIGFRGEILAESQRADTTAWCEIDVGRLRLAKGSARIPAYASTMFDYHQKPSLPANLYANGPIGRAALEAEYAKLGLSPKKIPGVPA
jgi:predicted amidohydrolase